MARRLAIPSEDVQLRIVGPANVMKVARVQRVTINNDIPTTDIFELGNSSLAGIAQDTPNVTVTFSVFDVGIRAFSVMTGTDWAAYPAAGVDISELGEADVILDIRDTDADVFIKTAHGKRLQVRDFTFTYSVDGESTEDYTLIGSEKRWFKHEVIVDRFVSGTTSFALSQTPIQLKNGNDLLSVILDGEYLEEVTAGPGTGEYEVTGTTLTTGDTRTAQVLAIYHAIPGGTTWVDVDDDVQPAAVRGRDVDITIAANGIPRVQSVTINGNLNVQPVREMGSRVVTGYQKQVSTVEGTITVLDTDTELISLFTDGTLSGAGVSEFSSEDICPTSGISLKIEITDPCDTTLPLTVLKTVYLDEITMVGESYTSNVNNNAQQTFNFKSITAHCVVYSGVGP